MGGNAFHSVLGAAAFPRLPPAVYKALKTRIQPILEELYVHVGVPREAPQKEDHGDLDIVVCLPRRHAAPTRIPSDPQQEKTEVDRTEEALINAPHQIVAALIGAQHSIPMDGNRTSNFAVPVPSGEWAECGQHEAEEETKARKEAGDEGIFYQIDVNVCESKYEWDRRIFFNSFGDLNMILGLIARNAGLHYSNKGLKYPDQPHPPILLSDSFDEILDFFGWSMDEWKRGFGTHIACYEWAIKTKYFDPSHFQPRGSGIKKRKPSRTMYAGFTEWASSLSQLQDHIPNIASNGSTSPATKRIIPDAREAALDFFGKRAILEERREEERRREFLKTTFSGSRVRDWTGLGNYWTGVKKIMDRVRERFDGNDNVVNFALEEGEERLKSIVLEIQAELGIWSSSNTEDEKPEEAGKSKHITQLAKHAGALQIQ